MKEKKNSRLFFQIKTTIFLVALIICKTKYINDINCQNKVRKIYKNRTSQFNIIRNNKIRKLIKRSILKESGKEKKNGAKGREKFKSIFTQSQNKENNIFDVNSFYNFSVQFHFIFKMNHLISILTYAHPLKVRVFLLYVIFWNLLFR